MSTKLNISMQKEKLKLFFKSYKFKVIHHLAKYIVYVVHQ